MMLLLSLLVCLQQGLIDKNPPDFSNTSHVLKLGCVQEGLAKELDWLVTRFHLELNTMKLGAYFQGEGHNNFFGYVEMLDCHGNIFEIALKLNSEVKLPLTQRERGIFQKELLKRKATFISVRNYWGTLFRSGCENGLVPLKNMVGWTVDQILKKVNVKPTSYPDDQIAIVYDELNSTNLFRLVIGPSIVLQMELMDIDVADMTVTNLNLILGKKVSGIKLYTELDLKKIKTTFFAEDWKETY